MATKTSKKKSLQEDIQIEEAYRNVAEVKKQTKSKKSAGKVLLVIGLVLVLLAGCFGGYMFFIDGIPMGKILSNVIAAGVDVGGMTKEEAMTAIQQSMDAGYNAQSMHVSLVEHSTELTPEITKVTIDIEEAVRIAYSYGRSGSYGKRKFDQLQASTAGITADISSCITIDETSVRKELDKLAENYNSQLTQTAYEIVGQQPSLAKPEPSEDGTQSTQTLQELVITKGTPKYNFSIDAILQQILMAYKDFKFEVDADCEIIVPDEFDLETVYNKVSVAPIDAVMDPETFDVSEHSYGYDFDLAAAKSKFTQTSYGEEVRIPFRLVDPQTKAQTLRDLLYKDVLGEYTAYTNSSWGRQTNLRLSCEAINGCIVYPGEIFSYNPVLGERTPDKGWEKADGYIGNKTVSEYGGGICQASSCLYLCAMLADLEIVERTNHGFISAYMPYGMDATVSWGGPEFKFKNTMEYPVKIEAIADRGNVTVRLLGTDTKDYYVKMEYEVLEVHPYKTVEETYAPDNKEGYKDGQVIITPYTGYKIKTYRCKYNKADDELISRDLEVTSEYARRDKIVCKIVDPAAATAPSETTPPPSQPSAISGTASEDG